MLLFFMQAIVIQRCGKVCPSIRSDKECTKCEILLWINTASLTNATRVCVHTVTLACLP
jgi:hypothetical protein